MVWAVAAGAGVVPSKTTDRVNVMSARTLVLNFKKLPLDLCYDRVGFAVVRATSGVHAEFAYRATYEKQLIGSNRQWTVSGRSPPAA
jgi:hypothetical protein